MFSRNNNINCITRKQDKIRSAVAFVAVYREDVGKHAFTVTTSRECFYKDFMIYNCELYLKFCNKGKVDVSDDVTGPKHMKPYSLLLSILH
jgi:hypothetical protein